MLARIGEARREAEWIIAQGGPQAVYRTDPERYIRFEDKIPHLLSDATPTTAAEALALIGFAIAAYRVVTADLPDNRWFPLMNTDWSTAACRYSSSPPDLTFAPRRGGLRAALLSCRHRPLARRPTSAIVSIVAA